MADGPGRDAHAETGRPRARSVHVRGGGTLLAPVQRAAEAFMAEEAGMIVPVAAGSTVRGIRAVIDGTAHVGMASAEIDADLRKQAATRGVRLAVHPLGHDGIVACVHPGNPVDDLGIEQLRRIYTGDITNWKDAGGPDLPIAVLSFDPLSGTFESWRAMVLGDESITPKVSIVEIGRIKARIAQTPGAIGYLAHSLLDGSIKALAIDGVGATPESIGNGTYALRRALNLVTADPPDEATARFIAFMRHPDRGQRHLARVGNVPLR
jgi:phosphate transport system substrate-binding protein